MSTHQRTCGSCGYITTSDSVVCSHCGAGFQNYPPPPTGYPQQQYQQPYGQPYQQPYGQQYQQPYGAYQDPNQPTHYPVVGPPGYPNQPQYPVPHGAMYSTPPNKVAAALLAFFLGFLGIHGFYLRNTTMGVTFLIISVVSAPLMCIFIGIFGYGLLGILCLIQTILYLVASDHEFYQKYVVEKRWF